LNFKTPRGLGQAAAESLLFKSRPKHGSSVNVLLRSGCRDRANQGSWAFQYPIFRVPRLCRRHLPHCLFTWRGETTARGWGLLVDLHMPPYPAASTMNMVFP